MKSTGIIIVAAGSSQRMGGRDKVFITLGGKPVVAWPMDVCQHSPLIDRVVLVLRRSELEHGRQLADERGWKKVSAICAGGERRQDSVREGLSRLGDCGWVLVHDGARPFLSNALIEAGIEAAADTGVAVAAIPAKDTVKLAGEDRIVSKTLERGQVWLAQTPQVFRSDIIGQAYEQSSDEATDDAVLAERLGYKVRLYVGDSHNIKITTLEDLILAETIAGSRS